MRTTKQTDRLVQLACLTVFAGTVSLADRLFVSQGPISRMVERITFLPNLDTYVIVYLLPSIAAILISIRAIADTFNQESKSTREWRNEIRILSSFCMAIALLLLIVGLLSVGMTC